VLGRNVVIPFALAILIWQLINAIADRVRKVRIMGQTAPRWARFVIAIAIMLVMLGMVVELIVTNAGAVAAAAPGYQANLLAMIGALASRLGADAMPTFDELTGQVDLPGLIRGVSAALTSLVGNAGLVLIYVVFLLFEQESFDRKIDALFPDRERNGRLRAVLGHIESRIETYIWIKTLVSAATGFLSWLVRQLFGVNFIPTIGSIFAVVLPVLLTLVQFASPAPVLAVLILLTLIQLGLGNVLEPRLMGSSLNLSPLVILLSLAAWGSLWGVAGMVLSVPLTVMLMIILAHFEATRPVAILLSATGRID
jgi:AI-2 transport protein TqsA